MNLFKSHKSKKKRVKKNTWYRNLRAWDLRLDRRQQQRDIIPAGVDETLRTCANCGTEYTGRVCPQCGQAGTWQRYTWKQAFMNFLDIWGLGNRPMFRTLRELFWRPGYMIRDYLNGHRQFYFPPFKLLAVSVALVIFTSWLTGEEYSSYIHYFLSDNELHDALFSLQGPLSSITNALWSFMEFLSKSLLYEWLFIGIFVVVCIWFAFRKVSNYNFVETYIFLIFVLSQLLICDSFSTIVKALYSFVMNHMVIHVGSSVALPIHPVHDYLEIAGTRANYLYAILYSCLIFLDYKQFYGLNWKSTLKRLFYAVLIGILVLAVIMAYFSIISEMSFTVAVCTTVFLILILLGFYTINKQVNKNKMQINCSVSWATKQTLLSLFFIPLTVFGERRAGIGLFWLVISMITYWLLIVALSLMPIVVYKKYHRTWLSWLVVPLSYILMILILLALKIIKQNMI